MPSHYTLVLIVMMGAVTGACSKSENTPAADTQSAKAEIVTAPVSVAPEAVRDTVAVPTHTGSQHGMAAAEPHAPQARHPGGAAHAMAPAHNAGTPAHVATATHAPASAPHSPAAHAAATTPLVDAHADHAPASVADTTHAATHDVQAPAAHPADAAATEKADMWMAQLGAGWMVMGMAQAFPIVTATAGGQNGSALEKTGLYLTQPALMFNVESPRSRVALRTTLNFEGLTQSDGELTFGGWGEGFIDKRHPHTLLHELMLSANVQDSAGDGFSISAGKGFAPYGTDDPMARPPVKYPTNHHLSQILERWTVNAVAIRGGWSLEAGLFGGSEPVGPYDLSNIESFGDSWSARLTRRLGSGSTVSPAWEMSASYGRISEEHDGVTETTALFNTALRHERVYGATAVYALGEASRSRPSDGDGYFSLVGEARIDTRGHQPYIRIEYATRPEYPREGAPGSEPFFRYDHDAHAIGSTRWLINTIGYGYELSGYPASARPFVELQHFRVRPESGGIDPVALFGKSNFVGISAGFRLFFGGSPMRMGAYGLLDAMTAAHGTGSADPSHGGHTGHEGGS